jgi:exosortase/archaeosortase family protein
MSRRVTRREVGIFCLIFAFWPVWVWYVRRIASSTEEMWSLLPLFTWLMLLCPKPVATMPRYPFLLPCILVSLYAATYPLLSPLPQAVFAITALSSLVSAFWTGKCWDFNLWGLSMLSLPWIPSLQFYLGYPLRVLTAWLAIPLLQINGFAVGREGTCLRWGERLIEIDAPCSGIQMLWTSFYLAFTLAVCHRLPWRRTCGCLIFTLLAVILGNSLRSATLFYLEAGILACPGWFHDGIGVVVFLMVAMAIAWFAQALTPSRTPPTMV